MNILDKQSKKMLQLKEVLAVILKETVEEYQGYSETEIMDFIEADSITEETEVSGGRTNTKIEGATTEFAELSEKTSNFDIAFRAKNPRLSDGEVVVNLYVDVEPQKNYRPGYPIEKRIIFQPHQKGFREKLSRYISFDEELEAREEKHMIGLGLSIYEEGIEQGIERGMGLNLFLLICKKLAKGKTFPEIAEALEEPEDMIQELCEKAMEYAPEYDEEKIRKDWLNQ